MIQVNLLPKEERLPEPQFNFQMPRMRVWLPALILVGTLLPLGGMYAMQKARISSLQADISQADAEMRRLKPQIDRIGRLTTEREELNLRLSVIQELSRQRYLPVEVMDHLCDQMPDYLWLTKVAMSGPGKLTVEGLTFSNLMVAELMSRMELSGIFDGVALTVSERAKTARNTDRPVLAFSLTAQVKP